MKKQVLILIVALMAISFSASFGQTAVKGSDPVPLGCLATLGPLTPIAGVPYDYSATVAPAGGSAYWYATTSLTFMTAGARPAGIEETSTGSYIQSATNYMVSTAGVTSPTLTNITWKSAGLTLAKVPAADLPRLFVVVEYDMSALDCANNLKVIPIRPIDAFTVDIKNMDPVTQIPTAAYGTLVEQCFSRVKSAVVSAGGTNNNGIIDYDFGTNTMYWEVIAANFSASFTPSFKITGLQNTQRVQLAWSYTATGTYVNFGTEVTGDGSTVFDYAGVQALVDASVANTSLGVSIYIRATIENDDFEGLATTPITLAVDALNAENTVDVVNSTCDAVALPGDFVDVATQNLKLRPTVAPVAPVIFIDKK